MGTGLALILLAEALVICVLAFAVGHLVMITRSGSVQGATPLIGLVGSGLSDPKVPQSLLVAARDAGTSSILAVRPGCPSCELVLAELCSGSLDLGNPLVVADGGAVGFSAAQMATAGLQLHEASGGELAAIGVSATPLLIHFDHRGAVLATELVPATLLSPISESKERTL